MANAVDRPRTDRDFRVVPVSRFKQDPKITIVAKFQKRLERGADHPDNAQSRRKHVEVGNAPAGIT